jgi:hypothetical protein
MKTVHALLAAASLLVTPSLFAQDDANTDDGDASHAGPRRAHVLRLRGVADGQIMELFALDLRFKRGDADGGNHGAGVVRIGPNRFHARVVEVAFEGGGDEPEPVPMPEPAMEDGEEPVTDGDASEPDGNRRRRQVSRLVCELHAVDGAPEPVPGAEEPSDGDGDTDDGADGDDGDTDDSNDGDTDDGDDGDTDDGDDGDTDDGDDGDTDDGDDGEEIEIVPVDPPVTAWGSWSWSAPPAPSASVRSTWPPARRASAATPTRSWPGRPCTEWWPGGSATRSAATAAATATAAGAAVEAVARAAAAPTRTLAARTPSTAASRALRRSPPGARRHLPAGSLRWLRRIQ